MRFGSTKCESSRSTSCGQVSSPRGRRRARRRAARPRSRPGSRSASGSIPARSSIASRERHPRPGRGEVDLAAVARDDASCRSRRERGRGDELLGAAHRVVVVGVRLVPLEHRELGVVLERDALVAEVLADLVDALEAADDQPLEVQLGGDPQVEVAVELVVVRRERAGVGAAVERLQDRRLDLDEAGGVEVAAQRRDHARAQLRRRRAPRG